jgi:hypothetical protein
MSVWSARRYRMALETTAALAGTSQPKPIPTEDRMDQNPAHFANYSAWELSQAFRGPQDFAGPKPDAKKLTSKDSNASTGSGSLASAGTESSGWDEEVLKKKGKVVEATAPKKPLKKKSFFGLFTPPWRACAGESAGAA